STASTAPQQQSQQQTTAPARSTAQQPAVASALGQNASESTNKKWQEKDAPAKRGKKEWWEKDEPEYVLVPVDENSGNSPPSERQADDGSVPIQYRQSADGRNWQSYSEGRWTPFSGPIIFGDGSIKVALDGKEVHIDSPLYDDGTTALMNVAASGNIEYATHLINAGANVNAANKNGFTALMKAASNGYTDTARLLIDNGAQVNATHKDGYTALMFAALYGHADTVRLLVGRGAQVNSTTKRGATALMLTHERDTETMGILRAAGARR
ncbi:MAG: ankyrin repeat domain-containing protein, partial [Deltaproteobacteria bacterium]|nr:ankyrin repeat domain-containing protein [Deltaproteobacteria bacterium]